MSEPPKVIDLSRFRSPGVRVYAGRDRGQAVREACGIQAGDRVVLIIPADVFSIGVGFPDELLRDTVIVQIIGTKYMTESVIETLRRRRVSFTLSQERLSTPTQPDQSDATPGAPHIELRNLATKSAIPFSNSTPPQPNP